MMADFGTWSDLEPGDVQRPIRILHVDDDADFTEMAALLLERQCDAFEVVSENSAADGLDRLDSEAIDCIVSDYQMPGTNGLEFFDRIPDDDRIPFILFTGRGSEEVASEAFSAGVTDYLQKAPGTDQFTVLVNRITNAVEKARSDELVATTRRRFKTLVEESNDAIFVVGSEGTIRYATPASERILGKPPEELVGTDGFEPIHPDDVDDVRQAFGRLVANSPASPRVEFRYQTADVRWIWVEARGRNLLDNEDINGIVVYVRDVDDRVAKERELAEREQKFSAVFEQAFDAMVLADDDGAYVEVNPAASDLFGLAKEDLIGRTIGEFAPAGFDVEAAWEAFRASERDRGYFPLVRPDGDRRVVEFAATANVIPNRHLSILRDVTDDELDRWDALIA